MAGPRINRFTTVTAEKKVCYAGRWVEIGEEITVPTWIAGCFLLEGTPGKSTECYPSACSGSPYIDTVAMTAGTPVTIAVPDIDGCGRPAKVEFTPCVNGCFFAEYNAPVVLPDGTIEGGISPEMNPTYQMLCEPGEDPITEISLVSPEDGFVQLMYTGTCDC